MPKPLATALFRCCAWLLAAAASGCAVLGNAGSAADAASPSTLFTPPAAWQAPLPHHGQLGDLSRWWQQFDDPLLVPLIAAAQAASPSVSAARSRIVQARAVRVAAGAALAPSVGAEASALRSSADLSSGLPSASTRLALSASAAWELDLFGGNAAARDAAQARLEGVAAQWHEARVSVAAETANQYTALRACEAQLAQTELDARSRSETARLTGLLANAGFQSPANAALARASAAQGNAQQIQQRGQCESSVKALVALTGRDEAALRSELSAGRGRIAQPAALALPEVPAALLRQRPDLAAAERELLAAQGDVAQARAAQWPSLSLVGSIGSARLVSNGISVRANTWTVGPLSVNLPLFDGGALEASLGAARARREDAAAQYAARLRTAVQEVENALLALDSAAQRSPELERAAEGFAASLRATEARYQGGLASLFELEDARRSAVGAQVALIDLRRDGVSAWIALYRALGGGWTDADLKRAGGGWTDADLKRAGGGSPDADAARLAAAPLPTSP